MQELPFLMQELPSLPYKSCLPPPTFSQTVAPGPSENQLLPYLVHRIRWREGHALASRDDLDQWRQGDLRP